MYLDKETSKPIIIVRLRQLADALESGDAEFVEALISIDLFLGVESFKVRLRHEKEIPPLVAILKEE